MFASSTRTTTAAIVLAFLSLSLSSCGKIAAVTHPYSLEPVRDSATRDELARHAVFVDDEGFGIEPRVGHRGSTLGGDDYDRYIHRIMDGIRSHRDSGFPDVMIRIHGGLNSLRAAPATTARMNEAIRADTSKHIYPLFINWDSGIIESYGEHLFFVRQGQRRPLDLVGAPFFLVADLGRAATRLPIVWFGQLRRTNSCLGTRNVDPRPDSVVKPRLSPTDSALKAYLALNDCGMTGSFENDLYKYDDSLNATGRDSLRIPAVSRFAYHESIADFVKYAGSSVAFSTIPIRSFWAIQPIGTHHHHRSIWEPLIQRKTSNPAGKVGRALVNTFSWLPPKVLALMLLDAVGTPAWENMRRRTKTMFQRPYASNDFRNKPAIEPKPGAVAVLFDSLDTLQSQERALTLRNRTRITLVGHSMGAIVASEALRTHKSLEVANVVYMAPALSLREFQVGTLPYLEEHTATEFFNLTLHPISDLRETSFHHLAPYGSLLTWLDAYLVSPESEMDRMMGKYQNATEGARIFDGPARSRMHLKAFGYGDSTGCGPHGYPYEHGNFNEPGVPFWDRQFWRPRTPCPDSTHATSRSH
jgi:hypothetical protein